MDTTQEVQKQQKMVCNKSEIGRPFNIADAIIRNIRYYVSSWVLMQMYYWLLTEYFTNVFFYYILFIKADEPLFQASIIGYSH